jgi:hypothetical protein
MVSLYRSRRARRRSTASTAWRHPSELIVRRGMLVMIIAALVLTALMVVANAVATLQ